jgi:hypothetical protein
MYNNILVKCNTLVTDSLRNILKYNNIYNAVPSVSVSLWHELHPLPWQLGHYLGSEYGPVQGLALVAARGLDPLELPLMLSLFESGSLYSHRILIDSD